MLGLLGAIGKGLGAVGKGVGKGLYKATRRGFGLGEEAEGVEDGSAGEEGGLEGALLKMMGSQSRPAPMPNGPPPLDFDYRPAASASDFQFDEDDYFRPRRRFY